MRTIITLLIAGAMSTSPAIARMAADAASDSDRFSVPETVSPQAKATLGRLYSNMSKGGAPKEPATLADYDALNARASLAGTALSGPIVQALKPRVVEDRLGGVPVLRVYPANPRVGLAPVVFIHGGGFILFSARSKLGIAALVAATSGREVISVDYTLAPRGNYRTVTNQVVSVWKALLAAGLPAGTMALSGDSAGGNIAVASTLKMRDEGVALPGALYLLSPSADLSQAGDTYQTLRNADPILDPDQLPWLKKAYVGQGDAKSPYASPVYGDFGKAFPPTLIQAGTREILLSDFVRLYQAIRSGGREAVLDVYEGMPHVFQELVPNSPEAKTAGDRATAFLDEHLKNAQRE